MLCQFRKLNVVYSDLSKASDSMNHGISMRKFQRIGLTDKILSLIQSCITSGQNVVWYGFICIGTIFYYFGLPQGSILGPLLFAVYFNDVREATYPFVYHILYVADKKNIFSDCHVG